MKKILHFLVLVVIVLGVSLPCLRAEATTVALLPLINNVEGNTVANQVYYKEVLKILKAKEEFVVIENSKLNAAVEAACIVDDVPNKATLAKIAQDGGVDIVLCMELDDLELKAVHRNGERDVQLDMKGEFVAYNNIIGYFYKHKFSGDKIVDASLTSRWDWVHEEFGRQVRIEIKRALKAKK